ncbi:MAG: ATP-binding cassette domain-containing protein [Desulfovibrionaceae bacterium]|nr:ATP-binding cassette domain-containing protein [Desulfovibrionaceae bacterium]
MLKPENSTQQDTTILRLTHVTKKFVVKGAFFAERKNLTAVNDVSFHLNQGECLGLVGESGCGKSTLGRLACGLLLPTHGTIHFLDQELPSAGPKSWAAGRIQMVFQDPFSSLNPRLTVGASVAEPLIHRGIPLKERRAKAQHMLKLIGLAGAEGRYPHEFSGGQRQRLAVARALITKPDVIICDEPVSALDASVQAQVLNLLCEMQEQFSPAYLFISHDLNVVGFMCQRILVMYLGQLVEEASKEDLFSSARHPYTQALLAARPGEVSKHMQVLQGELPSPLHLPKGCFFHPRCPKAQDICHIETPLLRTVAPGVRVRCHLV